MGPRSLGLRIALVAVPMAAVIATYDDGVAARSVIENLSKQGSLAVKHFLPANDVQDHARAGGWGWACGSHGLGGVFSKKPKCFNLGH